MDRHYFLRPISGDLQRDSDTVGCHPAWQATAKARTQLLRIHHPNGVPLPSSGDAGIHHTVAQQQVAAAGTPHTGSFLAQEQEPHHWKASVEK